MQAEARKVAGEGLGAAQEGPAAQVAGGGPRAGLDRGEGDRAQRRARARGGRVRQPAAPEHAPAVGSHHPLRAQTAARPCGAGRSRRTRSARRPRTTPTRSTACRRRRSATRAAPRSRPCSIRADTKELYFVADGAGGHVFSETLKDHNANVQKWRAAEKDMKGKAARGPPPTRRPRPRRPRLRPKTRAVVRTVPPAKAPAGRQAPPPRPPRPNALSRGRLAATAAEPALPCSAN